MKDQACTVAIEVTKPPQDIFNCINKVSKWWSTGFEGSSLSLNDEFIIHHPGRHYSKQKLVEIIPGKRVLYDV